MTKQAERDYALKVNPKGLYRRPFRTPRVFREFAAILELFLKRLPAGGSVLDLGCGPGWTSLFLAKAGYDVTGVDIAERMIEIARERSIQENVSVRFAVADVEELSLEQRDFDGVLLFDALHHCPGYEAVLRRAYEHLVPGGYLLLMEPTWLHLYSPHARREVQRFGVTELGFTRRQLTRCLRRVGFREVEHVYDGVSPYQGLLGFLKACVRLACTFLACYPQAKHIILARK